jgi:hypothetical protein
MPSPTQLTAVSSLHTVLLLASSIRLVLLVKQEEAFNQWATHHSLGGIIDVNQFESVAEDLLSCLHTKDIDIGGGTIQLTLTLDI